MLHSRATVLTGIDAAVLAWRLAVGTVSPQMLDAVSAFVAAEKTSGCWDLTDDYWVLWGENQTQALTSLKQRRVATAVNSPTFTASRGYLFDNTSNYIDTNFVPSTNASIMAAGSARVGVYIRNNVSTTRYALGALTNSNRLLTMRPRSGTSALLAAMYTESTFTLPAADSRGFTSVLRNGGDVANALAYKNGATMVRAVDPTSFGATLPAVSILIGANNNNGTPAGFSNFDIGFACAGASMSAAQELAQYNAVQAFATAVGAQV